MGQASSKGKVSKRGVTKFENHVCFDLIIKMHSIIIQDPNRLKRVRIDGQCRPEFNEAAVSNFIRTYERWLPLQNFDNCEYTRHIWISSILIRQASAIHCGVAGT